MVNVVLLSSSIANFPSPATIFPPTYRPYSARFPLPLLSGPFLVCLIGAFGAWFGQRALGWVVRREPCTYTMLFWVWSDFLSCSFQAGLRFTWVAGACCLEYLHPRGSRLSFRLASFGLWSLPGLQLCPYFR